MTPELMQKFVDMARNQIQEFMTRSNEREGKRKCLFMMSFGLDSEKHLGVRLKFQACLIINVFP